VKSMVGMFYGSAFNGDISQWDISSVMNMNAMFMDSAFKGDLRPWNLTETQMEEAFQETLPNYLATRQIIEEAEKLHATFGSSALRSKKVL
jgi:hypothetical protein